MNPYGLKPNEQRSFRFVRKTQVLLSSKYGLQFFTLNSKMGLKVLEPNTCIRGCCSSQSIPLHLPPSSYTLLSPIARGKPKKPTQLSFSVHFCIINSYDSALMGVFRGGECCLWSNIGWKKSCCQETNLVYFWRVG